ncbi:MAG: hypothetical protein ABSB50_03500 [Terracidiphilus sp.]|jgi:hypothetical protein
MATDQSTRVLCGSATLPYDVQPSTFCGCHRITRKALDSAARLKVDGFSCAGRPLPVVAIRAEPSHRFQVQIPSRKIGKNPLPVYEDAGYRQITQNMYGRVPMA